MTIVTFHFESGVTRDVAMSDWYCKPAILRNLAQRFGALFVTADKYGCRQFLPFWSSSFPVNDIQFFSYKEHLPWIVIEFNSFAKAGFDSSLLKRLAIYYDTDNV